MVKLTKKNMLLIIKINFDGIYKNKIKKGIYSDETYRSFHF